jgi:hypothetical protein
MRTKTLLAAAVLAAGLATSMAQSNVYSLNVVGYVNQVYPAGFSMVNTPLKGTNDLISTVLANAPVGTTVYKFTGGAYEPANSLLPFGWGSPGQTLPVGQGYFIKSAAPWTNTFVGEVVTQSTNSLINGFNMVGSKFPAAGTIDTALQLVPTVGDTAYTFNNGGGYNTANSYLVFGWGGGSPVLNVAQGVMYKSAGAKDWVQNFTIQ